MNPFPPIFARAKAPAQIVKIRDSFGTNLPTEISPTDLSPKPIRLRRPGTSLKRTLPKDLSDSPTIPVSPMSSHTHTAKKYLSRPIKLLVERPYVRGKALKTRDRRQVSTPVTEDTVNTVLNLETITALKGGQRPSWEGKQESTRAKSAEHREIERSATWDVSVTDIEISPLTVVVKEHCPTSIVLGAAQLPSRLSLPCYFERVFGEPVTDPARHSLVIELLESSLFVSLSNLATVRMGEHAHVQEISTVVTGKQVPVSRCCKAAVVFSCSKTQGGKALCTASYCPTRTICNFHIPVEVKDRLWSENNHEGIDMTSVELSAHVRKGSYKVVSLRKAKSNRRHLTSESHHKRLFTNERLRHVSPLPGNQLGGVCVEVSPVSLQGTGHTVQSLLHRSGSRSRTGAREHTGVELMAQLTCLLQV